MSVLNEDTDARELASAIETCPEIAARVVGLACSAYFAQRIPCRSVHDAIVRVLGFRLVNSLVIGIVMSGAFPSHRCPGFNSHTFWSSSVLSATVARSLARITAPHHRPDADDCFMCGLLHNIGVLVLSHLYPREMSRVFTEAAQHPECTLMETEARILQYDHTQGGATLAQRWQLPPAVYTVIARHRDADYRGEFWQSCMLVNAAAQIAAQMLTSDIEGELQFPDVTMLGIAAEDFAAVVQRTGKSLQGVLELAGMFA